MEEEAGIIGDKDDRNSKEVYTKVVRAGKRTYFFDVKATRKEDYYLTITESKKRQGKEGKVFYEKHKIFLYKEDFDKFTDGLREVVDFISDGRAKATSQQTNHRFEEPEKTQVDVPVSEGEFTNVDFDDLGRE
ncbi:MAG: DUF3276 family protein [Bacteroidales bacterium]